mmetsp:Transcript_58355/g.126185  ORF Transcript_58355/g.126185 Transcript_58355/m.126185 type:complete len:430 (+) Transcript_58355:49-1338(+)
MRRQNIDEVCLPLRHHSPRWRGAALRRGLHALLSAIVVVTVGSPAFAILDPVLRISGESLSRISLRCTPRAVGRTTARASANEEASDLPRRAAAVGALAAVAIGVDAALRASNEKYSVVGTILAPAPFKETLRTELVKDSIWGFEQVLALGSVTSNIRMTVVKLRDGTLWVSAPITPTRQCLRLLDELGPVAHLVVPTAALEHSISLNEFARIYPDAKLWVSPGQSTYPLLSPSGPRLNVLGKGDAPPWHSDLDYKVFYVSPPETASSFSEVAFFHRDSKTLLVTDCALKVPTTAPKILESYGNDGTPGPIAADQWRFKALAVDFLSLRGKDDSDFAALTRPPAIVNPLLRFLVYKTCESTTRAWVESVAQWPFQQVIAAHFDSPFPCNSNDFLSAFGFLFGKPSSWEPEDEQLAFLRGVRQAVGGPDF